MPSPLTEDQFDTAAVLLAEGFPARSVSFWLKGLDAMRRHCDNLALHLPWGWLLHDGAVPVGVALAPASQRDDGRGGGRPIVNLSSWYVRPQHRLRAAPMLRAMVADTAPVYIDVTSGPEVGRMLQLLGFSAVGEGNVIAILAAHAVQRSASAEVRELGNDDHLPPGSPPHAQLIRHRELNFVSLLVKHALGETLLVYRRRRLRGMPAAQLFFVGSHAVLHRYLGAVARHLLLRGIALLMWDRRPDSPTGVIGFKRPSGIWYAKGDSFHDKTDFIGSELCILNL